MSEATVQQQILNRLIGLESGMHLIKHELDLIKEKVIDDSILSEEDKKDLSLALKEEKEGKLLSKKQVFG